jgi:hypothetical protein
MFSGLFKSLEKEYLVYNFCIPAYFLVIIGV